MPRTMPRTNYYARLPRADAWQTALAQFAVDEGTHVTGFEEAENESWGRAYLADGRTVYRSGYVCKSAPRVWIAYTVAADGRTATVQYVGKTQAEVADIAGMGYRGPVAAHLYPLGAQFSLTGE